MPSSAATRTRIQVHRSVLIRSGGPARASLHVWIHPAFGDSESSYRQAFESVLTEHARVFVYDPPGHGASPALEGGLTIERCAWLWRALIRRYSAKKRVVLVGHSMAGVVACRVATSLATPPALVIGVESNLTRGDAYLTGQSARFDSPAEFHDTLRSRTSARARSDENVRRYALNFERADPMTLWTLGRSMAALKDPGAEFRRLRCPRIYYWDGARASPQTRAYVERHRLPHRQLDRLGHWPMLAAPEVFYAAIAEDVASARPS